MSEIIDLRSDTLSQPCTQMRQVIANAPVGDDVYGEDPSVNALQDYCKQITGKEAVIFVPTCTQANLLATLSQCERGDEYIVGARAHLYYWETGGTSALGGIQAYPIPFNADATLDLDLVQASIKPSHPHFPPTKLLCLENTHEGKVVPLDYLKDAHQLCKAQGLKLHIDGARIFNAMAHANISLKEYMQYCDTMSICFSKGLGAPIGSMLCGSHDVIQKAIRLRKMLGGGMRQSGMMAAACQFALENNFSSLKQDHQNAKALAEGITALAHPHISLIAQNTNMLFLKVDPPLMPELIEHLKSHNIIVGRYIQADRLRVVLYKDIKEVHVNCILESLSSFKAQLAA